MSCAWMSELRTRWSFPGNPIQSCRRNIVIRKKTEVAVRLLLLLAAIAASSPACAGDAEKIIGTWKLVSVVYDDVKTHELTPVLGQHPRGYQIATPEGRWLALVTADNRPLPKTEAERARALQTMISYSGHYRVEDGKVI